MTCTGTLSNLPTINVIKDLICASLAMHRYKILCNPINEVILEDAFNQLVQQIRCDKFVDVGSREIIREWLQNNIRTLGLGFGNTYNNIAHQTILIPQRA
jgi:hypothetical protein